MTAFALGLALGVGLGVLLTVVLLSVWVLLSAKHVERSIYK